MTKLLLAILTAAAFVYAVYLLARKRPLKIVSRRENESGFLARARYLFLLATAIIASGSFSRAQEIERLGCYELVATPTPEQRLSMIAAIRAAWLTLNTTPYNPNQSPSRWFEYEDGEKGAEAAGVALKRTLDKAVSDGLLSTSAAEELQNMHAGLAYHFWRSHCAATCYRPVIEPVGRTKTVVEMQRQLDLLRQARENKTISAEVVQKSAQAIQTQMEILKRLNDITTAAPTDYAKRRELGEQLASLIKEDKLKPSPATIEATALILELENATAAAVTAEKAKADTPTVAPTGTLPAGKSSAAAPGAASAKGQ